MIDSLHSAETDPTQEASSSSSLESSFPDLFKLFEEWNARAFDGMLLLPELRYNTRLRSSAGRFIPSRTKPVIEIAAYLLEEERARELIRDTLGHEMIHYWLWVRRRPYGHTPEFHQKMNQMGVSRYNSVPRHRPFKHAYECPSCSQKILVRRKIAKAACLACCKEHSGGAYDSRFILLHTPLNE